MPQTIISSYLIQLIWIKNFKCSKVISLVSQRLMSVALKQVGGTGLD